MPKHTHIDTRVHVEYVLGRHCMCILFLSNSPEKAPKSNPDQSVEREKKTFDNETTLNLRGETYLHTHALETVRHERKDTNFTHTHIYIYRKLCIRDHISYIGKL